MRSEETREMDLLSVRMKKRGRCRKVAEARLYILLSHAKYKLSHAFREYLHTKKEYALTAEELCYLGVEFVNKCKLLYCLMHQLFIVNGDPGARIFIGQELTITTVMVEWGIFESYEVFFLNRE